MKKSLPLFYSFLFICILMLPSFVKAQVSASDYNRNGITTLWIESKKITKDTPLNVKFSSKFDNNQLPYNIISPSFENKDSNTEYPIYTEENIKSYFEKNRIANEVVEQLFQQDENGFFSLDLLSERAQYNATDADVLITNASKRGEALIKDFGINLVDNSYFLVFYIKEFKFENLESRRSCTGTYDYFVLDFDFKEPQINAFYDAWIYEDDAEEIKAEKRQKIDQMHLPINVIQKKTNQTKYASISLDESDLNTKLKQQVIQSIYETGLFKMSSKLEQFQVKQSIYQTDPIRSKIGKKENVKVEHCFLVKENIMTSSGDIKDKRKAAVRAKSVVDNREMASGHQEASTFYQVSGGKIEDGMTLVEKPLLGIGLSPMYESGESGGAGLELSYRMGSIIRVTGFHVFVDISMNGDYTGSQHSLVLSDDIEFTRMTVGLAKHFNFARSLELGILAGGGIDLTTVDLDSQINTSSANSNKDDEYQIFTYLGKVGLKFGWNFSYRTQLFCGMNTYFTFRDAKFFDTSSNESVNVEDNNKSYKWSDLFSDRKGIAASVGLRVEF